MSGPAKLFWAIVGGAYCGALLVVQAVRDWWRPPVHRGGPPDAD